MTKKYIHVVLASLMVGAISVAAVGCGSSAASSTASVAASEATAAPVQNEAPVETAAPVETETPAESEQPAGSNALVAYFSWSGNTAQIAEMIATATGADMFEIATAEPYTDDYDELLTIAQNERSEGARPELSATVDGIDAYDTIYLGWPCWWGDCPMAVLTFLESYDFSGKTIVPFTTHGGSGFSGSLDSVATAAPGAVLLDGLAVADGSIDSAQDTVNNWLTGLGLMQ